jgi:transcriptional regulator with XRE-family HTH domain
VCVMTESRKTKRRVSKKIPKYLEPIIFHLKEVRLKKNIRQADLEHQIGLGEGYLSKWETGSRIPNIFNLVCWASALELQIDVVPKTLIGVANDNGELIANDNLNGDNPIT